MYWHQLARRMGREAAHVMGGSAQEGVRTGRRRWQCDVAFTRNRPCFGRDQREDGAVNAAYLASGRIVGDGKTRRRLASTRRGHTRTTRTGTSSLSGICRPRQAASAQCGALQCHRDAVRVQVHLRVVRAVAAAMVCETVAGGRHGVDGSGMPGQARRNTWLRSDLQHLQKCDHVVPLPCTRDSPAAFELASCAHLAGGPATIHIVPSGSGRAAPGLAASVSIDVARQSWPPPVLPPPPPRGDKNTHAAVSHLDHGYLWPHEHGCASALPALETSGLARPRLFNDMRASARSTCL
jgi:hypothetical protein